MIYFGPVQLSDLDLDDMQFLKDSIEMDPASSGDKVRDAFLQGHAVAWRFQNGSARGLFVIEETAEGYLLVWHVGGKGIVKHRNFIEQSLESYAKLRGLRGVEAHVRNQTLVKMCKRLGYTETVTVLRKEF